MARILRKDALMWREHMDVRRDEGEGEIDYRTYLIYLFRERIPANAHLGFQSGIVRYS
jgi:hypothetical protein